MWVLRLQNLCARPAVKQLFQLRASPWSKEVLRRSNPILHSFQGSSTFSMLLMVLEGSQRPPEVLKISLSIVLYEFLEVPSVVL